ncbi:hypothetical protein FNF27_04557 [Cafeteria roenbergensis]|uniref:Guanylate cyclase domain-containing protein n=1 Tax=Cafeteria roenbergensis TaxID=33653 RepID=A0A5A8E8D0_CAFRO|nr:hypothetical protein FNF27_04557 [Cafeteria roenbergensis]
MLAGSLASPGSLPDGDGPGRGGGGGTSAVSCDAAAGSGGLVPPDSVLQQALASGRVSTASDRGSHGAAAALGAHVGSSGKGSSSNSRLDPALSVVREDAVFALAAGASSSRSPSSGPRRQGQDATSGIGSPHSVVSEHVTTRHVVHASAHERGRSSGDLASHRASAAANRATTRSTTAASPTDGGVGAAQVTSRAAARGRSARTAPTAPSPVPILDEADAAGDAAAPALLSASWAVQRQHSATADALLADAKASSGHFGSGAVPHVTDDAPHAARARLLSEGGDVTALALAADPASHRVQMRRHRRRTLEQIGMGGATNSGATGARSQQAEAPARSPTASWGRRGGSRAHTTTPSGSRDYGAPQSLEVALAAEQEDEEQAAFQEDLEWWERLPPAIQRLGWMAQDDEEEFSEFRVNNTLSTLAKDVTRLGLCVLVFIVVIISTAYAQNGGLPAEATWILFLSVLVAVAAVAGLLWCTRSRLMSEATSKQARRLLDAVSCSAQLVIGAVGFLAVELARVPGDFGAQGCLVRDPFSGLITTSSALPPDLLVHDARTTFLPAAVFLVASAAFFSSSLTAEMATHTVIVATVVSRIHVRVAMGLSVCCIPDAHANGLGYPFFDETGLGSATALLLLLWLLLVGSAFNRESTERAAFLTAAATLEAVKGVDVALCNLFPVPVAAAIKAGRPVRPKLHRNVAVMWCDLVGFTDLSTRKSPTELLELLTKIYTAFECLCDVVQVIKVDTVGDAFVVVAGMFEDEEGNPLDPRTALGIESSSSEGSSEFDSDYDSDSSEDAPGDAEAESVGHSIFSSSEDSTEHVRAQQGLAGAGVGRSAKDRPPPPAL